MTQNIINETENTTPNYKALYDDLIKQHTALKRKTKYGLVWEDKPEDLDNKDIIPLFKHRTDLSLNPTDQPMNYLIEGDNYHSLKVLQHTHKGKIDVIYIDPPYNTGNTDFVYNDKYVDADDGFRHSKWLSFMDKRLRLARELLSQDGVIFVSIDDNEQAQLKLMMDKIFGERNFTGKFIWEKNPNPTYLNKDMRSSHEYVYVYGKKSNETLRQALKVETDDSSPLQNKGNPMRSVYIQPRTSRILWDKNVTVPTGQYGLISIDRDIRFDQNGENMDGFKITGTFRFSEDGLNREINNGRKIIFKTNKMSPRLTNISTNEIRYFAPHQHLNAQLVGTSQTGNNDAQEIGLTEFSYPKPLKLMKHILSLVPNKSATVLDFFAGSGTTGHAVMELNKEDVGNRSFILCTNNEVSPEKERTYLHENNLIPKNNKTEYNKYKKEHPDDYKAFTESDAYQELGIAQAVTRERLKRVIEGYTTPKGKVVAGLPNNLTYLQTNEFPKAEVNSLRRKELANLALNSHILKYPESEFETFTVDLYFDIDDVEVTPGKTPTFFVNLRDMKSYAEMQHEITSRFGNHVIIQRFEDYYDLNHDK